MDNLQKLLETFAQIEANPRLMMEKYLSQGKKVVGCFPVYTPQEIIHAAGMVPIGLWGGRINPAVAGKYAPIFTCSIMRSCLELGMTGGYQGLSAAVMPMLCDTFRGMSGAWRAGVEEIPLIAFIHPQNRVNDASLEFLASEYRTVKERLESIAGKVITCEEMNRSIELYNLHAKTMLEFCDLANDHLDLITPSIRHIIMKSALFVEKAEHMEMMQSLIDALRQRPLFAWKGKRVILTGITAEPQEFLDLFAQNDIAVIGDDLAQETRQYRTLIPRGEDPLERLAQQWIDRKACATVHEAESTRGEMLVEMAKKYKADGIAVCLMKFCDVEEYEYPMIVEAAEKAEIPTLCLEIDQSTQDNEQSRTKIQSFAEML